MASRARWALVSSSLPLALSLSYAGRVTEYKYVGAKTVLDEPLSSYCIDQIHNRFEYDYHQNARGTQHYSCTVHFTAKDLAGAGGATEGHRRIEFESAPVLEGRSGLLSQGQFLTQRHGEDLVFYRLPNSVYKVLSGVSPPAEQAEIRSKVLGLLYPISSFNRALQQACLLLFVESQQVLCRTQQEVLGGVEIKILTNLIQIEEAL